MNEEGDACLAFGQCSAPLSLNVSRNPGARVTHPKSTRSEKNFDKFVLDVGMGRQRINAKK